MAIPAMIGRYEIRGELGRGGFATVYLGFDPLVDREVAVKLLAGTRAADESFRRRFNREARTIASLEHSAIVPIYDFGEDDGQPYFVMRRMRSGSLADRLRQGPLSLGELLPILRRVAEALDSAHSRDIIHRDVKPANVLFDEHGQAYLSDFGIARSGMTDASLTGPGFLGTPAYISPEQALGNREVTSLADIYAFGCMAYECLTGHPPFVAAEPLAVLRMHLQDDPVPLHEIDPTIPTEASLVLLSCLAKDPADRPQSASAVALALFNVVPTGDYPGERGPGGATDRPSQSGSDFFVAPTSGRAGGAGGTSGGGGAATGGASLTGGFTRTVSNHQAIFGSLLGVLLMLAIGTGAWLFFVSEGSGEGNDSSDSDDSNSRGRQDPTAGPSAVVVNPVLPSPTPVPQFARIAAGGFHNCGTTPGAELRCWGLNASGQATPPPGTFTLVVAGTHHTCGIRSDTTLICWGLNDGGQTNSPTRSFIALSAGRLHSCGLTGAGAPVCWGDNSLGQTNAPAGPFQAISSGAFTTCGILRSDQSVLCWGDNRVGQGTPPTGVFLQVSVGEEHGCGIRADKTLACWGSNGSGQATPPAGTFTSVTAGRGHSCALAPDGAVSCWGLNRDGESTAPAEKYSAIFTGNHHNCGFTVAGTVACWGRQRDGQSTPPAAN